MSIKHWYRNFGFALVLTLLPPAAQAAPANMLIYISPQEYTHSVKLWQFYADYWFEQGPVVEPLATSILAEEFGEVAMCKVGSEGKSLIWLKPTMYYNPHMQTYYGQITASAFTGSGEPVAEYVGESQKRGFLDVYPQQQIESVYKMALQNLVAKMQTDQQLKSIAADGADSSNAAGACAMVASLPSRKLIDADYFLKRVN